MKSKVIVEKQPDGPWSVTSTAAPKVATFTFNTKVDAVTFARSNFPAEALIIKTAAGQVIRPAQVTPSQAPEAMYQAILEVVSARTKKEAADRNAEDASRNSGATPNRGQVNERN